MIAASQRHCIGTAVWAEAKVKGAEVAMPEYPKYPKYPLSEDAGAVAEFEAGVEMYNKAQKRVEFEMESLAKKYRWSLTRLVARRLRNWRDFPVFSDAPAAARPSSRPRAATTSSSSPERSRAHFFAFASSCSAIATSFSILFSNRSSSGSNVAHSGSAVV